MPGVSVALHVDQQNKAEQFWLKPQMGVYVLETAKRNVSSKNALTQVQDFPTYISFLSYLPKAPTK